MNQGLAKHLRNNKGKVSLSAILIASVLVVTGSIYFTQNNEVNAAALTSLSDTLGNSAPSSSSTHTIQFTTPTGIAANATMTITFSNSGFTTGTMDFADLDLADDTVDVTLADVPSGATWGATTTGVATGWLFTNGSAAVAADSVIEIQIGTNSATGDENMGTPAKSAAQGTADVYTVSVGGGFGDSGDMLIAIVEGVSVSVTIDESLTFTATGTTNASCDTLFGTLSGPDTTATSVPFGTLSSANVFTHGCQELSVSTNASSGYVVTAETDTSLKSGSNLINNGTCDGTCTESATDTWATATNNGFAYSATGTDTTSFGSDTDYRAFACEGATTTDCLPGGGETAQTFMTNSSSVNNSTATIEFKLSFSGTQAAGTYSNTVTYIVTPTF